MDFYDTFLRRIPQRNTVRFRGDSEPMTCWSCAHCFVRRAPRRYGFYLHEVADATGINFVHQAPTLDHKLDHIIRRVASMGTGRFYRRFDRDGWQDIYRALLELSWEDVDFDQNCQWGEPQVIQELLCHTEEL